MIHVDFVEPDTPEWDGWKAHAAEATQDLVHQMATQGSCTVNKALYKCTKSELFEAFHGKCAYCESRIEHTHPGDVEHFRPKGGVAEEDNNPVMVAGPDGAMVPHPGYYWLAYDWRNLLPSCSSCNRLSKTKEGRRIGKGTRFPVADFRATAPGEEAEEQPLLLHPAFDRPENHLTFDGNTGIIGYKTARGRACVELLGLNRDGLPEERKDTYKSVVAKAQSAFQAAFLGCYEEVSEYLAMMEAYTAGIRPYSFAGRAAIQKCRGRLRPLVEAFAP